MTYQTLILGSWAVFILVWLISAFWVKKDIRGGWFSWAGSKSWLVRIVISVVIAFAVVRTSTHSAHYSGPLSVFSHDFFATSPAVNWLGAILTVAGVALAIWARFYLGRNWSPQPSVKENHELVTGGPYAYVRHPIYTGMLLAALGTLLSGSIFGLIVLVVGSVVFTARVYKEEKIMLELFPNEYAAYQKRTKHLIPFIW